MLLKTKCFKIAIFVDFIFPVCAFLGDFQSVTSSETTSHNFNIKCLKIVTVFDI